VGLDLRVGRSLYVGSGDAVFDSDGHLRLPSYTLAQLAGLSASPAAQVVEISDAPGGVCLAVSDGTAWQLTSNSRLVGISGAAFALPGVAGATTAATITVPANSMGPNGRFVVDMSLTFTGSTNLKRVRLNFGGTNMGSYSFVTAANTQARVSMVVQNRNATNVQSGVNALIGFGEGPGSPFVGAVDTTLPVTALITLQTGNAGETTTLESYEGRVIHAI
jgi:hypothetical protein